MIGVPERPSMTTPTAIDAITVVLQSRKNGSRRREAARRRRGRTNIRRSRRPADADADQQAAVRAGGRLREVGDDRDRGRDAQHAADHDVARAQGDLLRVGQRAQPHLPVDRPRGHLTELVGALQPAGETPRAGETRGSAPCWTSARSTPPASPQTGQRPAAIARPDGRSGDPPVVGRPRRAGGHAVINGAGAPIVGGHQPSHGPPASNGRQAAQVGQHREAAPLPRAAVSTKKSSTK